MARSDRRGNRKTREQRRSKQGRAPELGYYTVITNTEKTEKLYFEGLRDSLPDNFQRKLTIKVKSTKTSGMIEEGRRAYVKSPQYSKVWIVFDRDEVSDFDAIIEEAKKQEMMVGWSNPCIEIWFEAYFGKMSVCENSVKCNEEFKRIFVNKTGQKYSKADEKIYEKLNRFGDERQAIQVAHQRYEQLKYKNGKEIRRNSEKISVTTLYTLVEEIREICDRYSQSV